MTDRASAQLTEAEADCQKMIDEATKARAQVEAARKVLDPLGVTTPEKCSLADLAEALWQTAHGYEVQVEALTRERDAVFQAAVRRQQALSALIALRPQIEHAIDYESRPEQDRPNSATATLFRKLLDLIPRGKET